jgi:hypothetical protein
MYLLYRQRLFGASGYSGFEGRSYSLFHSFQEDMAEAVDMQNMVTALAWRYIQEEKVRHHDIPDQPSIESERRQIFFACAVGIPTFYIRIDTGNRLLRKILAHVRSQRNSRRYNNYVRVKIDDYKLALLHILETDAADLVEQLGLQQRLLALRTRLTDPTASTCGKIIRAVQEELPKKRNPIHCSAKEFNTATERYYRTGLKQAHLAESLKVCMEDCTRLEQLEDPHYRQIMAIIAPDITGADFVSRHQESIIKETAGPEILLHMIRIGLAIINHERDSN